MTKFGLRLRRHRVVESDAEVGPFTGPGAERLADATLRDVYGVVLDPLASVSDTGPENARDLVARLRETALELFRQNAHQWDLENLAHDSSASDRTLGRLKRLIDRSNGERTALINRLDALFAELVALSCRPPQRAADGSRVLDSETVGQLLDRISIQFLKSRSRREPQTRVSTERTRQHLVRCLSHTIAEALDGQADLPPGGVVKLYR